MPARRAGEVNPERLFVYGSLRLDARRERTGAQEAFALLQTGAALEGRATVAGRIYAPSWYPALLPGAFGRVAGEVWRIAESGTLARLDAYEGEAYAREALPALMQDGRTVTAWAYCYLAALEGVPLITSGDYLDWVRTHP